MQARINLTFIVTCIALLIQLIRVFFGIDFNDEMQYYGELVSLLNNNKLFSNDLFVQQNVYLLLFPIFKPYVLIFGNNGLILFARILFAIYIIFIYAKTKNILVESGILPVLASLTALSLTFSIPLANVYAFSYNTVSLGILALCFAEFSIWGKKGREVNITFWILAVLVLLLVYPPMGLVIGVLLASRILIERRFILLARLLLFGFLYALLIVLVYLQFASWDDLVDSVKFSKAYGVGGTILTTPVYLKFFLVFISYVVIGILLRNLYFNNKLKLNWSYLNLIIVFCFVISIYLSFGLNNFLYPLSSLIVGLLEFSLSLLVIKNKQNQSWTWLSILFLFSSLVMVITSSNGFQQIQWPVMVATPFFLPFLFIETINKNGTKVSHFLKIRIVGNIIGVLILYFIIYLANPYRDRVLWFQNASGVESPAFKYIRMTENKLAAINNIKKMINDIPQNSHVMIIGAHPWIYFALDVQPDTDMIFMHTMGNRTAHELLGNRLKVRRPDFLIVASNAVDEVNNATNEIIDLGHYSCYDRLLDSRMINSIKYLDTYYDLLPIIKICKSPRMVN